MFSEKPTYLPKPKFTYHFSFHFQIPEIRSPRSRCYKKKKEKRTLETFSEKLTHLPKPKFTYHFSFHFQIPEIRSLRSRSYKKERKKNVRNVLREAHPLVQA